MRNLKQFSLTAFLVALAASPFVLSNLFEQPEPTPIARQEIVFWHFWGGADRDVVDDVVRRFNKSQSEHFVRAIAMPGNNLQAKLFLSVAGGDPPDLVNQDDPVLADWAARGVIEPIDACAPAAEVAAVSQWMLPSARRMSEYEGRMYGICNGLDIRALFYNRSALIRHGGLPHADFHPPRTLAQLDAIAAKLSAAGIDSNGQRIFFGYLPDTRRIWAWGYVFGASFFDAANRTAEIDSPAVIAALDWMRSYGQVHGPDQIAAFRNGDQSLPGKPFPLLPLSDADDIGRYAIVMDGQWRVRDIMKFQADRVARGVVAPEFGVCPLPPPSRDIANNARSNAGWVNGNFFVVPRGANNKAGAWEFAKFWIGYQNADAAADTCAAGGWIPVSQTVTNTETFQTYQDANPLFKTFVDLAASPNQFPIPAVVGASKFRRTVEYAGYQAINELGTSTEEIAKSADREVDAFLNRSGVDRSKPVVPH